MSGNPNEFYAAIRRLAPTTTAATVCRRSASVPNYPGILPPGDQLFLLSLIEQIAPRHILELGVAAGMSTLIILKYLETAASATTLTSVDISDRYYADPSKRVGFLVFEHLEFMPPQWRLLAPFMAADFVDAPELRAEEQAQRYDFVFIDAHHAHPWPTLDILCLLPFVTPGAWVALHDISLSVILENNHEHGPQFLIQRWPEEACVNDEQIPNIGAIQLSDAVKNNAAHLLDILELPWNCRPDPHWENKIRAHLQSFLDANQMARIASTFGRYAHLEIS